MPAFLSKNADWEAQNREALGYVHIEKCIEDRSFAFSRVIKLLC
jgi:hypothetical protein